MEEILVQKSGVNQSEQSASASPVIFEDKVFVSCTQVTGTIPLTVRYTTKIVAMNLNDGTILWNATLGGSVSPSNVADSTPAVYNGILYAASADGTVYALDTMNGTTLWSTKIYTMTQTLKSALQSSPAYADNLVYIGTPAGLIYALDASTGDSQLVLYDFRELDGSTSPWVTGGVQWFSVRC